MFNSSRHGIDGVFWRFGNDADIALLESKYKGGWRDGHNLDSLLGRSYNRPKMSPRWVREVRSRLIIAGRYDMADTVANHRYRFVNVLNSHGQSFIYPR